MSGRDLEIQAAEMVARTEHGIHQQPLRLGTPKDAVCVCARACACMRACVRVRGSIRCVPTSPPCFPTQAVSGRVSSASTRCECKGQSGGEREGVISGRAAKGCRVQRAELSVESGVWREAIGDRMESGEYREWRVERKWRERREEWEWRQNPRGDARRKGGERRNLR